MKGHIFWQKIWIMDHTSRITENSNYIYKIVHKFSLVNEFLGLFAEINQFWQENKKKISWIQQEPDHSPVLLIDSSHNFYQNLCVKETLFLCCHRKM